MLVAGGKCMCDYDYYPPLGRVDKMSSDIVRVLYGTYSTGTSHFTRTMSYHKKQGKIPW